MKVGGLKSTTYQRAKNGTTHARDAKTADTVLVGVAPVPYLARIIDRLPCTSRGLHRPVGGVEAPSEAMFAMVSLRPTLHPRRR